jgi:hypothetical protein
VTLLVVLGLVRALEMVHVPRSKRTATETLSAALPPARSDR